MIVDSKNIPQFIDELNIEVDQIKKELQQTVRNVEYASEYSEGVKLGDLLVGSQSTQVIAPQITMTAGPESGQFFLELPVGTESALTLPVGTESGQIVRPEVQNDANAASLVPEALLTGQTVESYLNSNLAKFGNISSESISVPATITTGWNTLKTPTLTKGVYLVEVMINITTGAAGYKAVNISDGGTTSYHQFGLDLDTGKTFIAHEFAFIKMASDGVFAINAHMHSSDTLANSCGYNIIKIF